MARKKILRLPWAEWNRLSIPVFQSPMLVLAPPRVRRPFEERRARRDRNRERGRVRACVRSRKPHGRH